MSLAHPRTGRIPSHLPREELARLLGITVTTVSRLVTDGVLIREEAGFPTAANSQAYARHVVDRVRRRASGSDASRRLAEAKAEAIRARLAREDRAIVDTEEALTAFDEMVETLAASFESMAQRADLPAHEAAVLADELRRFREGAAKARKKLRTGQQEDDDDGE